VEHVRNSGSIFGGARSLEVHATGTPPTRGSNVIYVRKPIKFGASNFRYSEECLVLESLNGNQINAEIRKLGIPETREYKFQYVYVDSAVVDRVGYDSDAKVMEVLLESGDSYRYDGITDYVFAKFLSSESRGRFFNAEIKGKYPSYKVVK
jgi:hypothetical protein